MIAADPPLGNELRIRPATLADIEAVRTLLRETWHQVYDPILGPESVAEIIARWHAPALLAAQIDQPHASFLVACEGERVVAHAFAYLQPSATLVVSRLYVSPTHQRRGIGQRLLAAVQARHAGAAKLRLFTAAENPRAVAFYRREGFDVVAEAIEEGARVLFMEKRLSDDRSTPP